MTGTPRAWKERLQRFADDREGGVAIIVAAFMVVLVILLALAVDVGSVVLRSREIQGAADLAALAAARDLPRAQVAATATVRENLGQNTVTLTEVGVYTADPSKQPDARFTPTPLTGANGVRVRVTGEARLYFASIVGKQTVQITRRATAAIPGAEPMALFSIGSRLLSLNGGLLNGLLSRLLGSNVNLSVMDYNKLVNADVNLLQFMDALSVELGLDVGDYEALLAHDVNTGTVLKVLEGIAGSDARSILSQLTGAGLDTKVKVGQLVGANVNALDGLRRSLNVNVSALDLLMVSLETANGSRQLALDTTVNAVVADVTLMLAIGEKPNDSAWITASKVGETVIRTSQTRLYAKVKSKKALDSILGLDVQVFAEVAPSEARIAKINCTTPKGVDVEARPGLLQLVVGHVENPGSLQDFKTKIQTRKITLASIIGLPVVDVYANLNAADTRWQPLAFKESDIAARSFKNVRSKQIASGLLNSLMDELKVDLLGILPIGGLVSGLLKPLGFVLGWLLDTILNPLLDLLGIGLGEADVRVMGMTCPGQNGIPNLVG